MTREIAAQEILFYASCEREGMIADNKVREHYGNEPAYASGDFVALAERTRQAVRQACD